MRRLSGRSTRSSTSFPSSRIATRVSRAPALMRISLFIVVHPASVTATRHHGSRADVPIVGAHCGDARVDFRASADFPQRGLVPDGASRALVPSLAGAMDLIVCNVGKNSLL